MRCSGRGPPALPCPGPLLCTHSLATSCPLALAFPPPQMTWKALRAGRTPSSAARSWTAPPRWAAAAAPAELRLLLSQINRKFFAYDSFQLAPACVCTRPDLGARLRAALPCSRAAARAAPPSRPSCRAAAATWPWAAPAVPAGGGHATRRRAAPGHCWLGGGLHRPAAGGQRGRAVGPAVFQRLQVLLAGPL